MKKYKWIPCEIGLNADGSTLIVDDYRFCVWSNAGLWCADVEFIRNRCEYMISDSLPSEKDAQIAAENLHLILVRHRWMLDPKEKGQPVSIDYDAVQTVIMVNPESKSLLA